MLLIDVAYRLRLGGVTLWLEKETPVAVELISNGQTKKARVVLTIALVEGVSWLGKIDSDHRALQIPVARRCRARISARHFCLWTTYHLKPRSRRAPDWPVNLCPCRARTAALAVAPLAGGTNHSRENPSNSVFCVSRNRPLPSRFML